MPQLESLKADVCSQGVKIPENSLGKHSGQAVPGEEPTQGLLEPAPGPAHVHKEGLLAERVGSWVGPLGAAPTTPKGV